MHRVKRPSAKGEEFSLSQIQSRTSHDNFGAEAKVRAARNQKNKPNFQLNALGGPLGEEFQGKS